MLIAWLLKYDGYPPGVVVALLLHGLLMYVFLPKEFDPANQVRVEPASFVVASAVKQSPQRMRRLQEQTQRQSQQAERDRQRERDAQRQRDEAAAAERQRQVEADRQKEAARQRQAEAQERQREAERQRVAEEEQRVRQEREREAERQRVADRQAQDAARQIAEANQAQEMSAENQLIAQYVGIIRDLVSGAWSRSPDAKNGMLAVVEIRLTPTGEIINSRIVQPSGSAGFDRSVQQAIERVGNFPELQKMPPAIFERHFRTLTLEFTPEDLLR